MAQKVIRQFTCDRCKKPYQDLAASAAEASQGFGKEKPKLILEANMEDVVCTLRFDDLCPRCDGRVAELVGHMRLDKNAESTNNAGATDVPPEVSKEPPASSPKEGDGKKKNDKPTMGTTPH